MTSASARALTALLARIHRDEALLKKLQARHTRNLELLQWVLDLPADHGFADEELAELIRVVDVDAAARQLTRELAN